MAFLGQKHKLTAFKKNAIKGFFFPVESHQALFQL